MSEVKRYDEYECGVREVPEFGEYVKASDFDAQRLRADTAEAERDDIRDDLHLTAEERDHAKRNSSAFEDRMGDLQVANGKLQDKLAAAERRIADTVAKLQLASDMLDDDERGNRFAQVLQLAIAALNPNPEAENHDA